MAIVIIERVFQEPVTGAQLLDVDQRNRWCLQTHRVGPKGHVLSRDGRRVVCVFEAPDAESLRIVSRKIGVPPPDRIWSATAHGPLPDLRDALCRFGGSDRSLVVVERSFAEPVSFDDLQSIEDRGAWCLSLNHVEHLMSWAAADRRRMICLFAALDAEAVGRTNRRLGLPFERVWSAELHLRDRSAKPPSAA